jgi:hypothetical protein
MAEIVLNSVPTEQVEEEQIQLASIPDSNNLNKVPELKSVRKDDSDWRVRLHLPEGSPHLYNDLESLNSGSILYPLYNTKGIIFPYTPTIAIQYNAQYENYDLVHSNYRGYFYKGSQVQNIVIQATFTAQDTKEANYMLAAMHFLRSCTKMFYGQDKERGMPPPVVMLTGLGEYHFNNHPCAITMVNYNLPNDVDYIAAGSPEGQQRAEKINAVNWNAKLGRLKSDSNLCSGAEPKAAPFRSTNQNQNDNNDPTKVHNGKTYVPTKLDINFTMIPIQTRDQVSNEFSLKEYASGKLLNKGFW